MTRVVDSVDSVDEAAAAIGNGLVVALATDTVYGLVVDATQKDAVGILARLKGRPGDVPVQVLVAGMEQALAIGDFSPMRYAWPLPSGREPRTLVVPVRPGVELQSGRRRVDRGDPVAGSRCLPSELCARCGPLAATSANRHGEAAARNGRRGCRVILGPGGPGGRRWPVPRAGFHRRRPDR